MAESVQYFMEEMVPELEDLEKRGIFSHDEIKKVVQQRMMYEYRLKRRGAKKIDFLRYVEYEMNLETLRMKRKKRLGLDGNTTISDHAIIRRIHFIFDRAVNKFKGDLRLWSQYIDFARQTGSRRRLSLLFARVLQLHPTNEQLWTQAALWEFEEKKNMQSARILMQRALRFNSENQALWLAYTKLELVFIQKLLEAKRDEKNENADLEKYKVDESESDENKDSISSTLEDVIRFEKEEATKDEIFLELELLATTPVLQASIPRILFQNAIKHISNDADFRLSFLKLFRQFPATDAAQKDVYKSLAEDFPNHAQTCVSLAERHFYGISLIPSSFIKALDDAETELNNLTLEVKATCFVLLYLDIHEQLSQANSDIALVSEVLRRLHQFLEKLASRQGRLMLSELVIIRLATVSLKEELWSVLYVVVRRLLQKATRLYSTNVSIWKLRLALTEKLQDRFELQENSSIENIRDKSVSTSSSDSEYETCEIILPTRIRWIQRDYELALEALKKSSSEERTQLCLQYVQWLERVKDVDYSLIETIFNKICQEKNIEVDVLLDVFLDYAMQRSGIDGVRIIAKYYTSIPGRSILFYKKWIELEKDALLGSIDDLETCNRLRGLYESALSTDQHNAEIWLDYIASELDWKDTSRAISLHWRAMKVVTHPDQFSVDYNNMLEKGNIMIK